MRKKKKKSLQHNLLKDLPPLTKIGVEYLAITPSTIQIHHMAKLSQKINVIRKGTTTTMTDASKMLMKRTKGIVGQVSGLAFENALKKCFIVFCFDGAVHKNTASVDKNIITYSLTLGFIRLQRSVECSQHLRTIFSQFLNCMRWNENRK